MNQDNREKREMYKVYLEVYCVSELCLAPIETIVTLLTIKYCKSKIGINLVQSKLKEREEAYAIDISDLQYQVIERETIPYDASTCEMPNITADESGCCIAGLCAVLRQIIKSTVPYETAHCCRYLLGFKESCLLACAEASVWTKFCEVDIISTLKFPDRSAPGNNILPVNLARFECHMSQPVRLHNIYKYVTSKKFLSTQPLTDNGVKLPEHIYAEGSTITLADVIIFVCVHILFTVYLEKEALQLIPLTAKWYKRMLKNKAISDCLFSLSKQKNSDIKAQSYSLPVVVNQSLYKSDPKRYKPRCRIYTRQEDINDSLDLIKNSSIELAFDDKPFGADVNFNWKNVPFDATPDGGSVPIQRSERKRQQLVNMCKPVLSLAKPGDVIVDFCSGGGHLGILLAHLLPNCTVILLENKEESLKKAKERVQKLNLHNIKFCQSNLDYFKADFNIGTSLHACGVATDLVIRSCIKKRAVFVSCPCCYGALQDCHHLTYPRSELFRSIIDKKGYLVIGHAADQTHDLKNVKTKQGYECMAIIDTDRKLQAEQCDYKVHLAKLVPDTCTPKNNILVGIPNERMRQESFADEEIKNDIEELTDCINEL